MNEIDGKTARRRAKVRQGLSDTRNTDDSEVLSRAQSSASAKQAYRFWPSYVRLPATVALSKAMMVRRAAVQKIGRPGRKCNSPSRPGSLRRPKESPPPK